MRWLVLIGILAAHAAHAALTCATSACGDPAVVDEVRAEVRDTCPCGAAASAKAHKKCWKPILKRVVTSRGNVIPKACRAEVTRALANSTCGRKGAVLCRKTTKKGRQVCRVAKASKCASPVDTGEFGSCADTCDQLTAEPFATTTELAAADVAGIESDEGGVMRFTTAPASLAAVDVGSVLVGGVGPKTPSGFLRVVLAVEHDGDALVLRTAQAPIQLAYKKLHVRFVRSILATPPGPAALASPARADVEVTKPFDFVLFDGDGSDVTMNDRIAVNGMIGGGFDFDFALDVDWGAVDSLPDVVTNCLKALVGILTGDPPSCSIDDLLPEAKVTFTVLPEVKADANVHGSAILSYEKQVDLASETLTPITIGPLVFVPVADITAELSGGASGEFSTGVHGSAQFETSVSVSSRQTETPKFKQPVLRSTDFGPNDTTVTLHAEAKIGVGSRLNLLLFGVTGPYGEARAYASIAGDVQNAPCWSLHTGIDANLGVRVTSPALPIIGEVVLVDWRAPTINPLDVEVATGECQAPPDLSTLPPGSGPDAIRLANPTYTPWSRTFTPAVFGFAGTGNSTNFVDLQRTIDGHYIHSGWAGKLIIKFDENGSVVWSRQLQFADGGNVYPLHVRSSTDASLLVVSRPVTAPILLTRLAQDGSVIDARAYDPPYQVCGIDPKGLVSDGAGGAWVAGPCIGGTSHSFLLHAEPERTSFWLLDHGDDYLLIKLVEAIGRDVFFAGQGAFEGALIAARMTPEGNLVYSKRYDACAGAPDAIPSQALVGPNGEVTIAGSGGAQHNGSFVRILPDGSLGFATFPGFGFGLGSVFLFDSLAELPTTGFVAGATHVKFNGIEPDDLDSTGLVGLDAAGHVRWAMRYSLGAPGAYVRTGPTAVHLSDDGGVVVTAVAENPAGLDAGRLWAFKPFAKDGTIDLVDGTAVALPLNVTELDCAMTASDYPIELTPVEVPSRSESIVSIPVALDVAQQTAQ